METLKSLAEITDPDERNLYFQVVDENEVTRRLTLQDIYESVSAISLHDGVPEEIRSHFTQARNLAVYAWFHYQFNVTAQLMGFVSVEYALKLKTGKSRANFTALIKTAIEEGWISDDGFTAAKRRNNPESSYVEVLARVMPSLRNDLAHGTGMLHHKSVSSLRTCAEFINQLFEPLER